MHVFHPISGAPIEGHPATGEVLPFSVLQATMLDHMDERFLHPILMLDKSLKVGTRYACVRATV